MKKKLFPVACLLLSSVVLTTSCIGSFPVFHKIHSWNQNVSGNKFVNELVFIAFHIIPVYEISYLADGLIFNTIEFWGGSSPIAKVGEKKTLKGQNGDLYTITTTENGYSIVDETKDQAFNLVFNEKEQSWNAVIKGASYKLMTMNEDGTVTMNLINGETLIVSPDASGVDMAKAFSSESNMLFDVAMK